MSAPSKNALKTAFKLLMGDLGGLDATASCTRVNRSQLSAYGSVNEQDRFPPVDVVMDAEAVGGSPRVTAILARAAGYELVPVEPRDDGELAADMARIGRDSAAAFATYAEAMGGRDLGAAEIDALIGELETLRRDAGAAMAHLARRRGHVA